MTPSISSAEPRQLIGYASSAAAINGRLANEARVLRAALEGFAASCTEYAIGVGPGLVEPLDAHVRRTMPADEWVRQVARQFLAADGVLALFGAGGILGGPVAAPIRRRLGGLGDLLGSPVYEPLLPPGQPGSPFGPLLPFGPFGVDPLKAAAIGLNATKIQAFGGIFGRQLIADLPFFRKEDTAVPLDQRRPGSDAWLYDQIPDAADPNKVKIATVGRTPDGRARTAVMVAGTDFEPGHQGVNANNAVSAAKEGLGVDSAYYKKVRAELRRLPPGTEVNLVGHSLGGMVVRKLANDPALSHLRVASVTTFGAPRTDGDGQRPGVKYRSYVEDEDPVAAMGRRTWPFRSHEAGEIRTDTGDHVNPYRGRREVFEGHTTYSQSREANDNRPVFDIDPAYVNRQEFNNGTGQFKEERLVNTPAG